MPIVRQRRQGSRLDIKLRTFPNKLEWTSPPFRETPLPPPPPSRSRSRRLCLFGNPSIANASINLWAGGRMPNMCTNASQLASHSFPIGDRFNWDKPMMNHLTIVLWLIEPDQAYKSKGGNGSQTCWSKTRTCFDGDGLGSALYT